MSRTGVGWSTPLATRRTRPAFSVTSARPSGRKAKPVGKLRPLTTGSSAKLGRTEPADWIDTAPDGEAPFALVVASAGDAPLAVDAAGLTIPVGLRGGG